MIKDNHIKEKICAALEGDDIEYINVLGKQYEITLKTISAKTLMFISKSYITAYVELDDDIRSKNIHHVLDCQTYHVGKVYGVDTAHSWNTGMLLPELRNDALYQMRRLIKSYLKLKNNKWKS